MGTAVRCDPRHSQALDQPAARGSGHWLSGESDRVSQGYGGSRTLWGIVPEVWKKDSADSLRGQRNQLLCPLPNRWKSSGRSKFVPAVAIRLAAYAG